MNGKNIALSVMVSAGLLFGQVTLYPEASVLRQEVGGVFQNFNHASTIAEASNGDLVIAWYGGGSEGSSSTRIWYSRKVKGSDVWTDAVPVDAGGEDASSCWNPVLFQPKKAGAPLLLYYKYSGNPNNWKGVVRTSTDNGATWSERIQLPSCSNPYPLCSQYGCFSGPTKNKPLE
ncbi:MAG: hypothetical protein GF350_17150, partial [Chitinivibrionales bacterium]|nr:hypothetical protein [Chitinivibrionales bacterium]